MKSTHLIKVLTSSSAKMEFRSKILKGNPALNLVPEHHPCNHFFFLIGKPPMQSLL